MIATRIFNPIFGSGIDWDFQNKPVEKRPIPAKYYDRKFKEIDANVFMRIKEKRKDRYTGTLFWTNELLGYTHMLSIEMPIEALKKKEGILKGRLFVYIPMQNVTKKVFNQNNYKKIQ